MKQEIYTLNSTTAIKRQAKPLPSLALNIVRALALLVITAGLSLAYVKYLGNPDDAVAKGQVSLEPLPLPEPSDSLNGEGDIFPDLLAGVVPDNKNPTELIDALGNPIRNTSNVTMAGGQNNNSEIIQNSSPQTIIVDGETIDDTANTSPLLKAPLAGLTRSAPFGPIPTIAADGRRAVTSYTRPYAPAFGKTSVSLIVGGLGIDRSITQRAIYELPPEITLSFAAHTVGLQSWVDQARVQGHEVILELPMESVDFNPSEPGAIRTLRVAQSAANNIRNLDYLISRAQGFFAVTNYNGDLILTRSDILTPILSHLSSAGLGFIYDGSNPAPTLAGLSQTTGLPFTAATGLIDATPNRPLIEAELARLEVLSATGQTPLGVGFGYGTTIDTLKSWVQELEQKNLELAPASYVINRR